MLHEIYSWANQSIAIWGFGREGQSTLQFIRKYFPDKKITVIDKNRKLPDKFAHLEHIRWNTGQQPPDDISCYDKVFKSPGIPYWENHTAAVTSQTALFIKWHREKIIGVTGTKGKSTTASLIHHLLKAKYPNAALAGNMGVPPFDILLKAKEIPLVVLELSAHQLHNLTTAPATMVVLNLFEEHLDYFHSKAHYYQTKLSALHNQQPGDKAIINTDKNLKGDLVENPDWPAKVFRVALEPDPNIHAWIQNDHFTIKQANQNLEIATSQLKLPGRHNQLNALIAMLYATFHNIPEKQISLQLQKFRTLPHRLEYLGLFNGIHFYNDSISTVPETTMAALDTIQNIDTLILGGHDRGINYTRLTEHIIKNRVKNIIFMGKAGQRMMEALPSNHQKDIFFENDMDTIVRIAMLHTETGKACVLSPAAASYDRYEDFAERGREFQAAIKRQNITE